MKGKMEKKHQQLKAKVRLKIMTMRVREVILMMEQEMEKTMICKH